MRAFSHDMKTPLESVIALAQMSLERLGGGEGEGAVVEGYLMKILAAARDMEEMADALMDGGEARGRCVRFNARELAASLSAAIGTKAARRAQMLHIDVSGLGEGALAGDRAALVRILTNLLGNAVKYTPSGGRISLTARIVQESGAQVTAEFVVTDNGMGMDAAFMERMFAPGAREDAARDMPGSGLGLSIVARMAKRMNGTIAAQSEKGKGTRMTLTVPLTAGEAAPGLTGRLFLLAEDNDLSAQIAGELLAGQGAKMRRAADGTQAVQLFLSQPAGTFDAILMDMRMPGMGGCRAARTIRKSVRADAGRIPILALTAGGDAQDMLDARAAGMNACLRKPLDMGKLREAMGGR